MPTAGVDKAAMIPGDGVAMPIRPELRPLYPPHWRELSSHVRFERAEGRCERCGRPHLVLLGPVTAKLCETAIVFAGGAFCQKCWAPGLESSRFFAAGIVTIVISEM